MHHSHEEIRGAFLELLRHGGPIKYYDLKCPVARVIEDRGGAPCDHIGNNPAALTPTDQDTLAEVFWELFRDGVISLGAPQQGPMFPFFHVSPFGKRLLEDPNTYFVHDLVSYEKAIRAAVPDIDQIALLYLKEAMQAFKSNCILSATVMLGVAAERTFDLLMDTIDKTPPHDSTFAAVKKERQLLPRINKFKKILDGQSLPPEVKEDIDTRFTGILSVIRESRNESGHPTGKIIDREMAYGLLCLFPFYCKKMYQLRGHFAGE